jgi:hypothetical protein
MKETGKIFETGKGISTSPVEEMDVTRILAKDMSAQAEERPKKLSRSFSDAALYLNSRILEE